MEELEKLLIEEAEEELEKESERIDEEKSRRRSSQRRDEQYLEEEEAIIDRIEIEAEERADALRRAISTLEAICVLTMDGRLFLASLEKEKEKLRKMFEREREKTKKRPIEEMPQEISMIVSQANVFSSTVPRYLSEIARRGGCGVSRC